MGWRHVVFDVEVLPGSKGTEVQNHCKLNKRLAKTKMYNTSPILFDTVKGCQNVSYTYLYVGLKFMRNNKI
jgi:hypothetical protein